jgi:hypothetical protein
MASQRRGREGDGGEGQFLSLPYKRPKNAGTAALAGLKKLAASDCHSQQQSPLFKLLCPKLRSMIFGLALQPMLHQSMIEAGLIGALKRGTWPEGRTHCTVDTALLQACRLIYLESMFIPVHNDIHYFYGCRWSMPGKVSNLGGFDLPVPLPLLL